MKRPLHLSNFSRLGFLPFLVFVSSVPALSSGCTSTETGNPIKDPPGDGSQGSPLNLSVRLQGGSLGMDAPGAGTSVTALWLQVSEVEFLTCSGGALPTSGLATRDNLSSPQVLTVSAPDDPICAIVVRTSPLNSATNSGAPAAGLGQGAVVEGVDSGGLPFSAIIPGRITSILTPAIPDLTLAEAGSLSLKIDGDLLVQSVGTYGGGAPGISTYDSSNSPALVADLQNQLSVSFSLERGQDATREVLAAATATWSEVDDLLCASECELQTRTACSSTPCEVATCLSRLADAACGANYREALHCRVGLAPTEYSCVDGALSVDTSHCSLTDSTYGSCGGL